MNFSSNGSLKSCNRERSNETPFEGKGQAGSGGLLEGLILSEDRVILLD